MRADQGYAVPHGPSIIETLWKRLDKEYGELMFLKPQAPPYKKQQGICAGLATAIAIMTNPYNHNEDAVRSEVVERRKARQEREEVRQDQAEGQS